MIHRIAQAGILGLTGLYFLTNLITGHITNYIAAKFVWLSWVAAALLIGLALAALFRPAHDEHDHTHEHDHGHSLRTWIGMGIVALPVVLGVLVPSQPLDSRAIDRPISSDLSSINVSPGAVVGIDPLDRNVLEWLRAFNDAADLSVFEVQAADLVGFVYRDARFDPDTQFMLARFVVSCCVADAQAIGITVESSQAAALHDDDWVRVQGVFTIRDFDGVQVPVLVAAPDGIQSDSQPDHPYLYP